MRGLDTRSDELVSNGDAGVNAAVGAVNALVSSPQESLLAGRKFIDCVAVGDDLVGSFQAVARTGCPEAPPEIIKTITSGAGERAAVMSAETSQHDSASGFTIYLHRKNSMCMRASPRAMARITYMCAPNLLHVHVRKPLNVKKNDDGKRDRHTHVE